MTASKPEVVAWRALHCSGDWTLREAPTLPSTGLYTGDIEGLIRLTDHERLQAEAERLQADHEAARAADKARIKLLEADAARYRWLRDHSQSFHTFYLSVPIWMAGVSVNQEKVDRSIDAAIALSQQGKENES